MSEDQFLEIQKQKKSAFTPREIVLKYIRFLPLIIFSLTLGLVAAYISLRYSTLIYNVNAKLLVKNNAGGSNVGEKFDDIFLMQGGSRTNITDEEDIIKSRMMAKRVINKLSFQFQYVNKGKFKSSTIHPREMPFIAFLDRHDSTSNYSLTINVLNENEFSVGEPPVIKHFGEWIEYRGVKWKLQRTRQDPKIFASPIFIISKPSAENAAATLSKSVNVVKGEGYSNIFTLSYETDNTSMGLDILNQYMAEYQQYSLEDKRQVALNTLAFIDEQLDTVRIELGEVERILKNYKEKNRVIDPEGQATLYLNNISESSKEISEQSVKMKIVDQLYNYINDQKNPLRIVPTSLGIIEPSLLQQITEYNRLLLERATTMSNTPAANPLILNIDVAINKLRSDLLDNLQNIRKTYNTTIIDLEKTNSASESRVRSVPGVQKRLLEINRQQKILEELYSYLLQKKLEVSIGSASTISSIRVIEPAFHSNSPISPNRKSVYLLAIFGALALPIGIIFLMEYLNDRVQSKRDVQRLTHAPILGEVGHSQDSKTLVVGKTNRKVVAEQFRMIRTNLQYVLHGKDKMVMMVTSSLSGEGKSFVSTNIAGVLALTGKRTVILEFDIRKPKILQGLGLPRSNGITNYIVGSCRVEDLAVPVPGMDNLFVIPCGPVPPNPAELLLDPKIDTLFQYIRNHFDAVIIDTAPVGLVSDAITLGKYADATVYIVRHNYTQKRQIQLIEDLYEEKKMPALTVVINDIKVRLGYGGYYGYGGYGYGYGYGYGRKSSNNASSADYYGMEEERPWNLWTWLGIKK